MSNEREPSAAEPSAAADAVLAGSLAELRLQRLELAENVAALTWDLGGLTYEMAIRDHYRLDVLANRAAELQKADAELGEIERLLGAAEAGVHGQCRSCGAVHSRGAAYCWRCGAALLVEARPSVLPDAKAAGANGHASDTTPPVAPGTPSPAAPAGEGDTQVLRPSADASSAGR
jgi:hypothetical protein